MSGFLDQGLPESRDQWPEGVLDAMAEVCQGDVVPCPPLVYHGDPDRPVMGNSVLYSARFDTPMPMRVVGEAAPRWAVITSATCDVADEGKRPTNPTVQVSPVIDMSEADPGVLKFIREGKYLYFVHLSKLSEMADGFWVADLRFEYPVEKGWLATQERFDGFHSEAEREVVGRAVAFLRGRPAMGDAFQQSIRIPLSEALTKLRQADRDLASRVDAETEEWAVVVDSRLNPRRIEIVLLSSDHDQSEETVTWWRTTVDALRQAAALRDPNLMIMGPRFERLDQIPVAEYRRLIVQARPHKKYSND